MDDLEIPGSRRKPRRLSKGMYILPSLFTTANIGFGYFAILQITHASAVQPYHFDYAAKAIGLAVYLRRSRWPYRTHDRHQ